MARALRQGRAKRVTLIAVGVIGAALAIEIYIWQFGLRSHEERVLNERLGAFLESRRAQTQASELLPEAWETICILPSYATAEHVESQLRRKFSPMDHLRWHLYWGSDDRYFGFAIVRQDKSVLPLKLWKTATAIDTDVWPAQCAARDHAIIRREHQLIALSVKN